MSDPTHLSVLLLSGVAFVAGSLDAIAGGGGLLTVPALLAVGLPPHAVLGTNKGQSLFGSLAAIVRYARAGFVDFRSAVVTAPLGFIGSLFGAALVLVIRPAVLRPIVLGLLLVAGVFVAFARPRVPGTTPLAWRARAIGGVLALWSLLSYLAIGWSSPAVDPCAGHGSHLEGCRVSADGGTP